MVLFGNLQEKFTVCLVILKHTVVAAEHVMNRSYFYINFNVNKKLILLMFQHIDNKYNSYGNIRE